MSFIDLISFCILLINSSDVARVFFAVSCSISIVVRSCSNLDPGCVSVSSRLIKIGVAVLFNNVSASSVSPPNKASRALLGTGSSSLVSLEDPTTNVGAEGSNLWEIVSSLFSFPSELILVCVAVPIIRPSSFILSNHLINPSVT